MVISLFYPQLGGAEQQALMLARHLMNRGVDITVLTRRLPNQAAFEFIQGIPVYRSIRTLPQGRFFALTYMVSTFWFFYRQRRNYDIIHCHILHGFHSVVALAFKRLFKKKVIIKVAATGSISDFVMLKRARFGSFFLKWVVRYADRIITVCSQSREEALQTGVRLAELLQVPNGVDLVRFASVSSVQRTKGKIIFIGRLDSMKGVDVLIRAFKKIIGDGFPAQLNILGNGPEKDNLIKLAESLGVRESVYFHGEVSGVVKHLQTSSLFVSPSFSEGLSNVILEAMACGLSVVATRVGGTPDLIFDRDNGLLVEPNNVEGLYESIKELLTNPGLAAQLGCEARKTVESRFSIDRIVDKYIRLYQELLH